MDNLVKGRLLKRGALKPEVCWYRLPVRSISLSSATTSSTKKK